MLPAMPTDKSPSLLDSSNRQPINDYKINWSDLQF